MFKKIIVMSLLSIFIIILVIIVSNKSDVTNRQWAIENNGEIVNGLQGIDGVDINIKDVWNITRGSKEVMIGIIDTGIDLNNISIRNTIFYNKSEIPNNSIDDDNNGYIDDINGWNFYDNNNCIYNDYLSDYHGTIIAGIIGGSHTDGNYLGIAPNVTLLPLKCFAGSTGDLDDVINAIEYAHSMGTKIINISWDTLLDDNRLYQTIKKYDDILFICAAGKNMNDLSEVPIYPASFDLDNIISVAAVNNMGKIYDLSGYGLSVDIAAPGENIYSIMPDNEFIYSNGTSMAAAYVTGISALLLSKYPNISVESLTKILKTGTMKMESLENLVESTGIIDSKRCFEEAESTIEQGE